MNFGKSVIIAVGGVPGIKTLIADFGCRVGNLPLPYLGLPLGGPFKSKEAWGPVVDKVGRKLAGWKANYLSKRGRLTLLKAAVANILVLFMSLFVSLRL